MPVAFLIDWMEDFASWMWCWVMTGIISAVNYMIAGLAAVIQAAIDVLPSMPSVPSVPEEVTRAGEFGRYWFPVDFFGTLIALYATLWAVWWVVAILLRWGKVTDQ